MIKYLILTGAGFCLLLLGITKDDFNGQEYAYCVNSLDPEDECWLWDYHECYDKWICTKNPLHDCDEWPAGNCQTWHGPCDDTTYKSYDECHEEMQK